MRRGARRLGPLKRNEINPARRTEGVGHKAAGHNDQGEDEQATAPSDRKRARRSIRFGHGRPPVASTRHLECDMGVAEGQSRRREVKFLPHNLRIGRSSRLFQFTRMAVAMPAVAIQACGGISIRMAGRMGCGWSWARRRSCSSLAVRAYLRVRHATASSERQSRSEAVFTDDARALHEPGLPDRGWPELNNFTRSEDADDVAQWWEHLRDDWKRFFEDGGGYGPWSLMRSQRGAGVDLSTCGSSRNAGAAGSRVSSSRSLAFESMTLCDGGRRVGSRWRCIEVLLRSRI